MGCSSFSVPRGEADHYTDKGREQRTEMDVPRWPYIYVDDITTQDKGPEKRVPKVLWRAQGVTKVTKFVLTTIVGEDSRHLGLA